MAAQAEVGARVFAVQSADQLEVRAFGTGTYVGDKPCPIKVEFFGGIEALRAKVQEMIEADDGKPVETLFAVEMYDYFAEQGKPPADGKSREDIIAEALAERQRPMEVRVAELADRVVANPCIELDDGGVVWGMECWWGPEENFEAWCAGRPVVTVAPQREEAQS